MNRIKQKGQNTKCGYASNTHTKIGAGVRACEVNPWTVCLRQRDDLEPGPALRVRLRVCARRVPFQYLSYRSIYIAGHRSKLIYAPGIFILVRVCMSVYFCGLLPDLSMRRPSLCQFRSVIRRACRLSTTAVGAAERPGDKTGAE